MRETLRCINEHNGEDTLLFFEAYPGAFTRGATLAEALEKAPAELYSYLRWRGVRCEAVPDVVPVVVQDAPTTLRIADADSAVLFDSERAPLTSEEYSRLSALAMRSAHDFQALYDAIPAKRSSALPPRQSFYGHVPRTAQEMYAHTRDVNAYYFGELGVPADNAGDIADCRARGFARLETMRGFLKNDIRLGRFDEPWTLRKLCRRFVWHDRIHARAMLRMAAATFGPGTLRDPYFFF